MSEKGHSRRGSGTERKPDQIPKHPNVQDEEDRFQEMWNEIDSSEDGEDIDPEKFLRDMAILDELYPLPDFDLSTSWEDFQEKYAHLLASPDSADQQSSASDPAEIPKRKRSKKPIRAVIAVGLILAMLMTAASCGVIERILKAFGIDSEDIFSFLVIQELRVENPKPERTDTEHFDSLEDALDAYGVTTEYAKMQYPEGFVFHHVLVAQVSDAIKFFTEYTCDTGEIFFTIWHYKDSTSLELQAAEKLPADAEIYLRNGIKHYILANNETTTVTWIAGTEMYVLAGPISSQQSEQMIDSLYEG